MPASATEQADYTLITQDGKFEVRHYESLVLGKTSMKEKRPFSKLFKYISGENESDQKIEMTAPVFMDRSENSTPYMAFVMPKDLKLSDTPQPKNENVSIDLVEDYKAATIRFNGRLSEKNIKKNIAELETWMRKNNLESNGEVKAAGYNSPFA